MGHNCVGHNNPSHNKPGGASPWAAELDDDGSSVFWQPDVTDENGCSLDLMDPAVWERHKLGKLWQNATTEAACEAVREHYTNMCSQVGGKALPVHVSNRSSDSSDSNVLADREVTLAS